MVANSFAEWENCIYLNMALYKHDVKSILSTWKPDNAIRKSLYKQIRDYFFALDINHVSKDGHE